ncbi:MAG: PGF-pre-PGF domain-containing protein, partial [Nanoarchaeota archaeon]|nr:PGF-pre-PGF domain-containing protein [Nanoarchaeota archaeon]
IPPTTYPSLVSASDSDKDGNIELTWSDDGNESGESYRVYRFTSNITSINSPVKNVTSGINEGTQSYEDSTSVHGQTYWYALVTVDAAGNYNDSIFSNTLNGTANDTISPNSVTNMNVTASGATATFRWYNATQDTSSNADTQNMRYVIYYGTNFNRSKSLANESITGYTTKTVSGNSTTISVSSTGKYHFVVTSLDDGGNKNLALSYSNNYGNASLTYSSDDGNGGSSGGGGGGGGGGGVATSSATMEFVNIGYIASGDTAKAEFTKEIGITQIEFKVKQTATASSITVADMGSNSGIALKLFEDDDKRAVHKYLKITLGKVSSTNIEEAVIRFNVPKDESFKPSTVRLRRYDSWNKHWATLPTTHYKEDVLNHYFRASTPGFSIFAITGETGYVEEDEEEEVEITAEVEDEEEEEVFEEVAVVEKKNTKILDWIMGIVAASFVFLIIAHVVLKKGKKLFE